MRIPTLLTSFSSPCLYPENSSFSLLVQGTCSCFCQFSTPAAMGLSESKLIVDVLSEACCNAENTGKIDIDAVLSKTKVY